MIIYLILSAGKIFREAAFKNKPYRSYAPTTLIHLASLVPKDLEAEVHIIDLGVDPLPENLNADLIGISTITCGANEAYRLASIFRKKGITVVMGGSHPTAMPDEALMYADCVVVGYAENTWPKLLRDFQAKTLKKIYKDTDSQVNDFILPKLNRKLLKKYLFSNCIESSRGCPNSCDFCVIRKIIPFCATRNIQDIVNEIETMGKWILFLDSNHTEFYDHNIQLWKELKRLKKNWFCAGSINFLSDYERVKYAVECGLKGILVGFESINQNSLLGINKNFNLVYKYKEIIKKTHDLGIVILGNFIFGFDEDDESIFEKTVSFVNETRIDIVKYGILSPFPGTPIFNKIKNEGRLLTENWDYFDTNHVVFQPKQMSPEMLFNGLNWAYKKSYTISSILKRLKWTGTSTLYSLLGNIAFRNISNSNAKF